MTVAGKVFVIMNLDNVGAFMDTVVSVTSVISLFHGHSSFFLENLQEWWSKSVWGFPSYAQFQKIDIKCHEMYLIYSFNKHKEEEDFGLGSSLI